MPDNRVGEAFENPDYTSSHYYAKRGVDNWGLICTPDELRYHYLWGNKLSSSKGDNYVDSQLQKYVDQTIAMVEKDLSIIIVGTQFRHRPPLHGIDRTDLPKDEEEKLLPFKWDDMYSYKEDAFKKYVFLKLHNKPIVSLQKWHLFDISAGSILIDLTPWSKPNFKKGYLRAYPRGDLNAFPINIGVQQPGGFVGFTPGLYPLAWKDYPNAYGVDYIAGYENAKDVPEDLIEVVSMLAAVNLMADYGDGVVSGLANASVSLSGISESYGTTLSATSAFFGARILDYTKRIGEWLKQNRQKYRGVKMRAF